MIEQFLKIELSDDGIYESTDDPKDLSFNVTIHVNDGISEPDTKGLFNPFGGPLNDKYTLGHKDMYYFLPGVTIPRIKLKDIANTHKVRTVRELESATHIFIGSDTLNKITSPDWHYFCRTDTFKEFMADAKANGNIDDYYYDKFTTAVEFYTNDLVLISWKTWRFLDDDSILYSPSARGIKDDSGGYNKKFYILDSDYAHLVTDLQGKTLYTEDSLLEYVNGDDAIVIDKSMFETLNDMFNSSDKDNWTLAMEIMANCKYKDSLVYLGILFHDHYYKIDGMHTKRHINFKSLVNYLGTGYSSIDKDDIMTILIKKKKVTVDNVNLLLDYFKDEIVNQGNSEYFTAKIVTVSEEIDKLLNQEVTLEIKSDYTPVTETLITENGTTETLRQ